MAGARAAAVAGRGKPGRAAPGWIAGGDGRGEGFFERNRLRALGQIGGVEQPSDRHRHEIGVGHVAGPVGKGELAGLGDQMPAVGAVGAQARQIEMFEDTEDLPHGKRARARRPHAAHRVVAVGMADRRPLDHPVGRQVGLGQEAGIAGRALHRCDDVAGDVAAVERARSAFGYSAQGIGKAPVDHHIAFPQCSAADKEIGGGGRIGAQPFAAFAAQEAGQPRVDGKPVFGQRDRRFE